MNEQTRKLPIYKWMNECMITWMNEWMNAWMDEWMNE